MNFNIFLLILICLAAVFAKYASVENFEVSDFYKRYMSDISVIPSFYSQGKIANNYPNAELGDEYFIDALNASTDREIMRNKVKDSWKGSNPTFLLKRIDAYLLSILNEKLNKDDKLFFTMNYSDVIEITQYKNDSYLIESRHLVHREQKIYGATIKLKTFHEPENKIYLVDSELLGFAFDDKIDADQPSNLDEDVYQAYKNDKVFTMSKQDEDKMLCEYYKKLKKYRGIQITSDINC